MRINHNLASLNTYRQLTTNTNGTQKSLEKLSSGLRINKAGDDAAGLAISEKMRGQIRGLEQASRNSQDGISMIQTAEGALNETQSILQRMRELSVQAANDTNTSSDRDEIQKEINQLTSETNRIGNTTEFNTKKLLNGDMAITEKGTEYSVRTTQVGSGDSGQYVIAFSAGANWSGQVGEKPLIKNLVGEDASGSTAGDVEVDNQIAFGASDNYNEEVFNWSNVDATADNSLTVQRSGDDILVSISAHELTEDGEPTSNVLSVDQVKMAHDETNKLYSYDANGVTFSISEDEFEKFTDGAKLELNLTAEALGYSDEALDLTSKKVSTASDFTQTLGFDATAPVDEFSADGILIDTSVDATGDAALAGWIKGVEGLKVTASNLDDETGKASYKVELLDKDGKAMVSEDYSSEGQITEIAYNQHGISFTFDTSATKDFSLEKQFDVTTTRARTIAKDDKSARFQIGANSGQSMSVGMSDMRSLALGISSESSGGTKKVTDSMGNSVTAHYVQNKTVTNGTDNNGVEYALDVSSHDKAAAAVKVFDDAVTAVSAERSKLGAFQNRLEHTINNLGTSAENLTAAESRVRDVDMAKEMMEFTKNNILTQAAQSMMAQANQQPQGVLQLLR